MWCPGLSTAQPQLISAPQTTRFPLFWAPFGNASNRCQSGAPGSLSHRHSWGKSPARPKGPTAPQRGNVEVGGWGRLCLPMLHSDNTSSWGQERTGGKACPSWETGTPPPIPVPSGGVLADGDKSGQRTPHLQPFALAQARAKIFAGRQGVCPRGWRSRAQARSSHRPRGGLCLVLCPQQGCCQVPGISLPPPSPPRLEASMLQSSCNQCHRLWSKAFSSCMGKQTHREAPLITSRTGEGGSSLGTVSLSSLPGLTGRMPGS